MISAAVLLFVGLFLASPVPAQSTDEVEALHALVAEKLSELKSQLISNEGLPEDLLADEFTCLDLDEFTHETERGWEYLRWHGDLTPADSLTLTHLSGVDQLEFKVISVNGIRGDQFSTDVLIHSLRRAETPLQSNLAVRCTWKKAGEELRLVEWQVEQSELVRLTQGPFTEVTGSIFDPASGNTALLEWGGDTWARRADRVGEPNGFGHQGTALGDVNGDGLVDLYVAMGTGVPNLLFLRQADGTLVERGAEAGVAWLDDTKGVLLLDLDRDGDLDLCCAIGAILLYCKNDGEGNFTVFQGITAPEGSAFYSLAAADYNLDGLVDVFALRYVKTSYGQSLPRPFHDAKNGPTNLLLRNEGEGGFIDVTSHVGLDVDNDRFSLAAAWADYDDDGDPDLYVANDFGRNQLYRNDGNQRFTNVAAELGVEDQAAGMGAAWSDYDRDGDLDLYVSNMYSSAGLRVAYQPSFLEGSDALEGTRRHAQGNSLFRNDGGRFSEIGDRAGVRMGRWSWGSRFVDLDANGYDDLIVPNGFLTGPKEDDL